MMTPKHQRFLRIGSVRLAFVASALALGACSTSTGEADTTPASSESPSAAAASSTPQPTPTMSPFRKATEPAPTPTPAPDAEAAAKAREASIQKWRKHWVDRVEGFRSENEKLNSEAAYTTFVGDSGFEGFKLDKFFPGKPALNRGIVSDHIGFGDQGVLRRLDVSVFEIPNPTVVLMIGVNDIGDQERTPAELAKGFEQILDRIAEGKPEAKVIVLEPMPCGGRYAKLNKDILEYNKHLKEITERRNLTFVRLHHLVADEKGELNPKLTRDGLHLTDEGYAIVAEQLRPVLGWQP